MKPKNEKSEDVERYPYAVLNLSTENVTDEEVRNAYIQLVRCFPPEKDPERFQDIRHAYEAIQTLELRLDRRRVFAIPPLNAMLDMLPDHEAVGVPPLAAVRADLHNERMQTLLQELSNEGEGADAV